MGKKKSYSTPLENAYAVLRERLDSMGDNFHVSRSDMEDLIQEGYLRLMDSDLKQEKEALGKLWVTMKNLSIDLFRKKKRHSSISDDAMKELSQESGSFTDYDFLRIQMKSVLSPIQYEIMTLLAVKEYDYSEIAESLDMTENAVRTNVSRARKILKEKLEL